MPEPPKQHAPLDPPGTDPMEGLLKAATGALLVDAMNGVNELGRRAML
jgi:hypothetical protein